MKRLSSNASGAERERGMTLVEVLVALAVLGVVAGAILALIGQNTRFIADAEEQALAGALADNLMIEALGRTTPLERGASEADHVFGRRAFRATTTIAETGSERLIRIDIAIAAAGSSQTLVRATTIKAESP
jgi:general secretion pathway protein I